MCASGAAKGGLFLTIAVVSLGSGLSAMPPLYAQGGGSSRFWSGSASASSERAICRSFRAGTFVRGREKPRGAREGEERLAVSRFS